MAYTRSTNAEVRARALLYGYTLADIARYLGKTRAWFSIRYFSEELPEDDREYLLSTIEKMKESGFAHEKIRSDGDEQEG